MEIGVLGMGKMARLIYNIGAEQVPQFVVGMCQVDHPQSNSLLVWDALFERFDEFASIHQIHLIAAPEEAWVICKDTASLHFSFVETPCKDALIVRHVDDLQLKTVKRLLPLPIQASAYSGPADP